MIKKIIIKDVKSECESKLFREIWQDNYGITIGMYTYGCFKEGMFAPNTIIGNYCSIAPLVRHLNADHPIARACMTPYFYNKVLGQNVKDVNRSHLEIENDVWIGYGAIILSKCHHIGNGAVIGAGSIVTTDVPPYAIVMGNPAKIHKYRFNEDERNLLESSKWWNYKPSELANLTDVIFNPLEFCKTIKKVF